jgi:aminopeptidase N
MRRTVIPAILILLAASGAAAQDRFGAIDRDLLLKFERPPVRTDRRFLLAPQPTPGQMLFDAIHYDVDIAFDEITGQVEGRVTAVVESTAGPLSQIDLNADPVLSILAVEMEAYGPLSFSRTGDVLSITLPYTLAQGERANLYVFFEGNPIAALHPGLFIRTHASGTSLYSLSEPWSARTWWPCKDYPDDKATFDIALSVRPGLFAASNGEFIGQADTTHWGEPFIRYTWKEEYVMPPYLFSIAASPYVLLTDHFVYAPGETMLVTNYVYPHLAAQAAVDLDIAVPALSHFSSLLGMYPFIDEKYGVATCGIGGGMEHQTLTSYGAALLTGDHRYDWVYIHELGHQWFGDRVTCADWTHIWLNEGWASYFEALWFEHVGGPGDLEAYMQTMDTPLYWHGPVLRDPGSTDPWYYFDRVVYDKGAWIVHMLRHIMGDQAFFDATRAYLADPQFSYGNADSEQFEAIFEGFYGGPLDWFFDPWLTRTDRLAYEWQWNSWEQDGRDYLSIFVDFRVSSGAGTADTVLWIDESEESFIFETTGLATGVQFDPDGWVLCDATDIASDAENPPAAPFLSQNWPNPFNPSTTLRFGLDRPGAVRLCIYNARGRLVRTLIDGRLGEGTHEAVWNGKDSEGRPAASGIYFCRMTSVENSFTVKMVLLR